jgi:hypothetical protein
MPIQPETPITMTDSDHFLHRVVFILVHFKWVSRDLDNWSK